MKKLLFFMLSLGFFSQGAQCQNYEETVRQYVLEKLVFYYVDNPAASMPGLASIEVDKVTISNGQNLTTPLWNNPDNAGLKTLLKKLLCNATNGGDMRLQRIVANVLLISDKKVYVFLYHDTNNPTAHSSMPIYCPGGGNYPTGHTNSSWPCASWFKDRRLEATGHIGIGSYFYSGASGGPAIEGHVFIHELVHTQIRLVTESTLGSVNMYGAADANNNSSHSHNEMIPSKNSAFNEGIATSFALRYHFINWIDLSGWLNTNTNLFVDNIGGCGASGTPPPHCLQTRLATAVPPVAVQASCGTGTKCYAIRDIPSDVLLHCENVVANILFRYMDEFDSEIMLVGDIKRSRIDLNPPGYTFTGLFQNMLRSSNNYRNASLPAGTTPKGASLTLAILDYYSGYKVDNLGALGRIMDANYQIFGDQYVRDYFSMTGRQTLLTYRTNSTTWNIPQQIDRFAVTMNVHAAPAPTPPAPAPSPAPGRGNE